MSRNAIGPQSSVEKKTTPPLSPCAKIPLVSTTKQGTWWYRSESMITQEISTKNDPERVLKVISDASVQYGKASCAAVIKQSQVSQISILSSRIWCNPSIINSYRAEAIGISRATLQNHTIPSNILCDNEAVVNEILKDSPKHPLAPEWDVIEPLRQYVEKKKIECAHVRGHQEKKKENLTEDEEYNVLADKEAENAMKKKIDDYSFPPGHLTSLTINSRPVTTEYALELRRDFSSPDMRKYLCSKYKLDSATLEWIDWDAISSYIKDCRHADAIRILKLIHESVPTHERLSKMTEIQRCCACGARK